MKRTYFSYRLLLVLAAGLVLWRVETHPSVREFRDFVRARDLDTGELFYTESELTGEVEFRRLKSACQTLAPCE